MPLAISTSWNASFHNNGKDLVGELEHFGFKTLELSFNLTCDMVEDVFLLQQQGLVKVLSVHNFCPIPDGVERKVALPDYYSLSSLDKAEREKALFFARRTIDTAERLDKAIAVFHTGKVDIQDKTKILIRLYDDGKRDSKEFTTIKKLMIEERQVKIRPHLEIILGSLGVLLQYAKGKGIKLGIENRYYFREIPSLEEFAIIFDNFKDLYYWHDVGHAQLWENLGFLNHLDYLHRFSNRMIGIHLHDIKGAEDHLPPLRGDFDFTKLLPFMKPETVKVIEAHYPATSEEIKNSAEYLGNLFKEELV